VASISSALDRGWYRCKICLYDFQKSCSTARIPPHSEGALRAIVTTREAGMRWPRWSRSVSLSDARTNGAVADAKACGPGAPKLALNQGVMIPLMSVAIKPDTGESPP
jgi:hypothetical protein